MIISTSYITPLQISCNSHFPPILGNGLETDLERTYNGPTVMAKTKQMRFFLKN